MNLRRCMFSPQKTFVQCLSLALCVAWRFGMVNYGPKPLLLIVRNGSIFGTGRRCVGRPLCAAPFAPLHCLTAGDHCFMVCIVEAGRPLQHHSTPCALSLNS